MSKAKPDPLSAEMEDLQVREKAIDALLAVVAAKGWNAATLAAIAEEAQLPMIRLQRHFADKSAIFAAFVARIDGAMLAGTEFVSEADSPKDRLFDVIMNRFEALRSAKPALARLWADGFRLDAPLDPESLLATRRSLVWTLEAAGISASGLRGQMRLLGLAGLMTLALRTFLNDTSEDLSATMARLDELLRRGDEMARTLRL
jgi:AcrR family transcriptional regulator